MSAGRSIDDDWSVPSEEEIHAEHVAALEATVFAESRAPVVTFELVDGELCWRGPLRSGRS